jgi:putative membrane protein
MKDIPMKAKAACLFGALALCAAAASADAAKAAAAKDETVYAILSPAGEVKNVIVSDRLKGDSKAGLINDFSDLSGIKNVAGEEKVSISGESLKWASSGKDIYYQGTSSKAPPLKVQVRYFLDGKELSPQAIAGKAGSVRVSLKVVDADYHERVVDGRKKSLATPFIGVVILDLPSGGFENVELSPNARALGDGKNNIVMGLVFPGLGEDLKALGMKGIEAPDEFSFTATTSKFAFGPVMITLSPALSGLGDLGSMKGLGDFDASALSGGLRTMSEKGDYIQGSVHALYAGSERLKEGIDGAFDQLGPKLEAYKGVADTATAFLMSDEKIAAARRLLAAAAAVDKLDRENPGAFDRVKSLLAKTMADTQGLDLDALAKMPLAGSLLSDANLASLGQALRESDAFYRSLDGKRLAAASDFVANARGYVQLSSDLSALCLAYDPSRVEGLRALASYPESAAEAAALSSASDREALIDKLKSLPGLSDSERAGLVYLVGAKGALDEAKASSGYLVGTLDPALRKGAEESRLSQGALLASSSYLAAKPDKPMQDFISGLMAQKEAHARNRVSYEIADAALKLASKNGGVKKTIAKIEALQGDLKDLSPILSSLETPAGSSEIAALLGGADASSALSQLAGDLNSCRELLGLAETVVQEGNLADARGLIASGPKLAEGLAAIREGTKALNEGLGRLDEGFATYNKDAIQKLASKLAPAADALGGIQSVAKELVGLSSGYTNFSGLASGTAGSVKFIMRTEEIEAGI